MVKGVKEEDPAPRHHNSEKILRRTLQRIDDNSDQNKEPLHFSSCTPNNVSTTLNCPFRQLAAPALYRTEYCLSSFILRNLKLPRVPPKDCFPQTLHVAVTHRDTHARV